MKHIRIWCKNKDCPTYDIRVTIPEGRPVAPGVTEKLGALVCDTCGHDIWKEPA